MHVDLFKLLTDGTADTTPHEHNDISRVETTITSNDGQQFRMMLLDADDSFDMVVQWPDGEREIVFSLIREKT